MYDLTAFQRDLLRIVAQHGDEPNGLEIKDMMEEYYEGTVHHGRLYPNLDTLCDLGLILKGEEDARTNFYRVTKRGQMEIEFQYEEWEKAYEEGE